MISLRELYTVLSAIIPLYVAMILGYCSVRRWKVLTPDQCSGINRFVVVFAMPLLSFQFIANNNPYHMNTRYIVADVAQKLVVLLVLALWVLFSSTGSFDWLITMFGLATLPNTLVMGVPLLQSMYGGRADELMVQFLVMQMMIWNTLLLLLFEYRAAKLLIMAQFFHAGAVSMDGREAIDKEAQVWEDGTNVSPSSDTLSPRTSMERRLMPSPNCKSLTPRPSNATGIDAYSVQSSVYTNPRESHFIHAELISNSLPGRGLISDEVSVRPLPAPANTAPAAAAIAREPGRLSCGDENGRHDVEQPKEVHLVIGEAPTGSGSGSSSRSRTVTSLENRPHLVIDDSALITADSKHGPSSIIAATNKLQVLESMPGPQVIAKLILTTAWMKFISNPNTYAALLGVAWSLIAFKFHIRLPAIVENSIRILSDAGLGMAMFSLGLFMGLQKRVIVCGPRLAALSMAVRFLAGPAVMAAMSTAVGLRGRELHIAIVQAALPQGIVPFVFAKEYNLHPDIMSTGVIFGMLVSLPITLVYYVALGI